LRVAVEGRGRRGREGARTDEDAEREETGGDQEQVDAARVQPRQALVVEPLQGEGAEGEERGVAEKRFQTACCHDPLRIQKGDLSAAGRTDSKVPGYPSSHMEGEPC